MDKELDKALENAEKEAYLVGYRAGKAVGEREAIRLRIIINQIQGAFMDEDFIRARSLVSEELSNQQETEEQNG